jgi:hypothetical protein
MPLGERGQYALGLGIIALMLYFAGLPLFLLILFSGIGFTLWKLFAAGEEPAAKRAFEFYLVANEILRDRRHSRYGFEIGEALALGNSVLRSLEPAPALVHFSLGALYKIAGDTVSAEKHLSLALEHEGSETQVVNPTRELREYVRILRRIERSPAEAPLTAAAIRSLERMRRRTGLELLDTVRTANTAMPAIDDNVVSELPSGPEGTSNMESSGEVAAENVSVPARKTISEVLTDVYGETRS